MTHARRIVQIGLATVVLGLLLGVGLPELCIRQARRAEERAAAAPTLDQRLAAWEQARSLYQLADLAGTSRVDRRRANRRIDQLEAAVFEEQRRTLAWGAAGARTHLAWLEALARRPDPHQLRRVRLHRFVAELSYGRPPTDDRPGELHAGPPALRRWYALAAAWWGDAAAFADLDDRGLPVGAPLLGRHRPKPDVDAAGLDALVRAEAWRRAGDLAAARALLAPLMRVDGPLAPLAAESWGLCLLDELDPRPPGMLLAEAGGPGPDPRARAALRALLLQSPPDDPAWLGAWLTLAELDDRLGDARAARAATWGAVEASLSTWAAPAAALPDRIRLDDRGMVHPQRVQRARVQLDAARLAAEADDRAEAPALRDGVVALLLVQARGQLAARNLPSARTLVDRARSLAPHSRPVIAWAVLTATLDGRDDDAIALLDSLPADRDDHGLRAVVEGWVHPDAPAPVDSPAQVLRTALRRPWKPGDLLAFARVHRQRPDDLWLALRSPPEDRATPVQALAQAWLSLRVARALGDDAARARSEAWVEAVREMVLDEPLWGLWATEAFTFTATLPMPAPATLQDGSEAGRGPADAARPALRGPPRPAPP